MFRKRFADKCRRKETMGQRSLCGISNKSIVRRRGHEEVDIRATKSSSGKIIFADIRKAQQTYTVKIMLIKHKTTLIDVPFGMTSLDVSINEPFKNHVRQAFEKHLDKNLAL